MTNDAKFGLLAGVAVVLVVAVFFYPKAGAGLVAIPGAPPPATEKGSGPPVQPPAQVPPPAGYLGGERHLRAGGRMPPGLEPQGPDPFPESGVLLGAFSDRGMLGISRVVTCPPRVPVTPPTSRRHSGQ